MADFRKFLLALLAGALLFASVASAAPYGCTASPTQTLVRVEGLAELVGDIVLFCSGDVPNPAVGIQNVIIRVTVDTTNITSNLLSGVVTEGTLILNEGLTAGGRAYEGYTSVSPFTPQTDGSQNVYQGVKVADNAIEWQGVVIAGPNSNPFSIIRLTNVRVNAAGLAVGAPVVAHVNITSPTSFPIAFSNNIVVANVVKGMAFSVTPGTTFNSCVNTQGATIPTAFTLVYKEQYGIAFKTQGTALTQNNVPGGNYPNESGFSPGPGDLSAGVLVGFTASAVGPPVVNTASSIGQATNPTKLLAKLQGVPAGVTLTVPATVTSDLGFMTATADSTAVTVTGGSATITYSITSVTGISLNLQDTVSIPVTAVVAASAINVNGTITAAGSYAPISTVAVMSGADPEPRFVDGATSFSNAISFNGVCHTLMLFPFLTNQGGFDTGIAISNTSDDQLGTPNQAGACTLNYFGNAAGVAVPVLQTGQNAGVAVTPSVPSGGQVVMILSAGAGTVYAQGTTPATPTVACAGCAPVGFQGYMIADCGFQYAHGYAFISDLGATKLAQGYLALIIPKTTAGTRPADPFSAAGAGTGEQLTP